MMTTITPTATTCCIIKDGWNYHFFQQNNNSLIYHRESERIPMNEKYYKIIGQHITVSNTKNNKIRMKNTSFPTFDEQKALKIVEEAIEKNQAHIEVFTYLIPI